MIHICLCLVTISLALAPSPPPLDTLPLLVTVYDTALCAPNTPCLQGNGDGYFASMIPVSGEWYGRMAACNPSLFGRWLSIDGIG